MRNWKKNPPKTFDDAVAIARELMEHGGKEAARIRKEPPPTVRQENMPNGNVRLVAVWLDGEETNEFVVQRLGNKVVISLG